MMEDIYPILAKHFLKEASSEEERAVAEFKRTNSKEYGLLKSLWAHQSISVRDFDSRQAWEVFVAKREKRIPKVIPLFGSIRNIAAAVAFLILGTFSIFYFTNTFSSPSMVSVENNNAGVKEHHLADGSVVWLNRGSSISYAKVFSADREVSLKGEAFFEVAKDSIHPFVVTADYSTITVLGTTFNIDTDGRQTTISVLTGKVGVVSKSSNDSLVLLSNHSALVTENGLFRKTALEPNYLSWKTGLFEFDDVPIAQVVEQLNTYYSGRVEIEPNKTYNCNLSAKFDKAPLDEIVQIIEVTCGLNIGKTGDHYLIE